MENKHLAQGYVAFSKSCRNCNQYNEYECLLTGIKILADGCCDYFDCAFYTEKKQLFDVLLFERSQLSENDYIKVLSWHFVYIREDSELIVNCPASHGGIKNQYKDLILSIAREVFKNSELVVIYTLRNYL